MTEYTHDLSAYRLNKAKDFQIPTAEQAKQQFDDAVRFVNEIEQKRTLFIQEKLALPPTA